MIKKELLLASWLEKLQKKWDNEEYYYDVEEATKVFKFVSKLTNDRGASRQFELLEFQFEIITEILCVKRRSDGKRKHREAHINIPRKNGKSFLAARESRKTRTTRIRRKGRHNAGNIPYFL